MGNSIPAVGDDFNYGDCAVSVVVMVQSYLFLLLNSLLVSELTYSIELDSSGLIRSLVLQCFSMHESTLLPSDGGHGRAPS